MIKFLKRLFSVSCKDEKYKNELLTLLFIITLIIATVFIRGILSDSVLSFIICLLLLFSFFVLLPLSIIRLFQIKDNKDKIKLKTGQMKFKYVPVTYELSDIVKWLNKATEPDIIYVKTIDGKFKTLEASFEVEGRNGKFINKQILINDNEILDLSNIEDILTHNNMVINDKVEVVAITEKNDPKLFQKILDRL